MGNTFHNRGMRRLVLLSFFVLAVSSTLLSISLMGGMYKYSVGDISGESIRVPWEIVYPIEMETEQEKRFAEENVPPVFDNDSFVAAERMRMVHILFNAVETVLTSGRESTREDQLTVLGEMLPPSLRVDKRILFAVLNYSSINELRQILVGMIGDLYEKGVLDNQSVLPEFVAEKTIIVRTQTDVSSGVEEKRQFGELMPESMLKTNLSVISLRYTAELPKDQQWALYVIAKSIIKPNIHYNAEETKRRVKAASDGVKQVMGLLKKGEVIVREGDPITIDAYKKIQVINKYTSSVRINYVAGVTLLQVVFFLVFLAYMSMHYQRLIPDSKTPVFITLLLIFFMGYSFYIHSSVDGLTDSVIFSLLLPIPFVALTISILYGTSLSFIISSFMIFFCFTLSGGDFSTLGVAVSSSLLSIFGTKDLEKRTDFLRSGLMIGIVNALVVFALGLMVEQSFHLIRTNIEVAIASGVLNAVVVIGFFPVFENAFGITTIFKLHELSDLNAPIFKKMLIRAPGTYNHSIMVANLAEAACREIDADYLLARVGGYYHDIGKIDNAGIFIENKKNPNEKPDMSSYEYSKLIISHVTKGIELARKAKIPEGVIDFIREHHGDSMMTFFYHQALEKAQDNGSFETVHRSDYQYPGPKPHTKETAIVMIADAIEAASRSIHEPSYVKLETLVKKIIYNRLNEGDLEHSDLTMEDLNGIQRAFLQVLNGIFHTRLEYPENSEIQKLEASAKINGNS